MAIVHVALVFLALEAMVVAGNLHPEGQAAALFNFQEQDATIDLPEVDDDDSMSYDDASQNDADVQWFKANIVDKYGFVKDPEKDVWKKQGDFSKSLGDPSFIAAAKRAEEFFKRNNDWDQTKRNKQFRKTGVCLELLYVTAARYLMVTQILWEESDKKITACEKDGSLIKTPPSVCYPVPYGTASCTSDYDVGLVGKDAGFLVAKFNEYFEGPSSVFKKPSEILFDTNLYAFSLEYSMPPLFKGLPAGFEKTIDGDEKLPTFQMQELAGALFKVYKYNYDFYDQLYKTAIDNLDLDYKLELEHWHCEYNSLNAQTPLKGIPNLRAAHNKVYSLKVKAMSSLGGYSEPEENLVHVGAAELYAAEALHTRGGMRHVVGGTQMKLPQYLPDNLPMMDLLVSMIENWGEVNKEFNHNCDKAEPVEIEVCLVKLSKYFWRTLSAMKELAKFLPRYRRKGLVNFRGKMNPEAIMDYWLLNFKRKGLSRIDSEKPLDKKRFRKFFKKFHCPAEAKINPFTRECLESVQGYINKYTARLSLVLPWQ